MGAVGVYALYSSRKSAPGTRVGKNIVAGIGLCMSPVVSLDTVLIFYSRLLGGRCDAMVQALNSHTCTWVVDDRAFRN